MAGDNVHALVGQSVDGLCLLHRHRPVTGKDHLGLDGGVDAARTKGKRVDVQQHLRNGLCSNEAELLRFGLVPGNDAGQILRHADIAEIRAGIRGVALAPQSTAMAELDIGVGLGRLQHEGLVVTEGCRKQELRAVQLDHRLHRPHDGVAFRHVLFFQHRYAGNVLHRCGALGMRLIVSEVVARPDIEKADRHVGGKGGRDPAKRRHQRHRAGSGQKAAAIENEG